MTDVGVSPPPPRRSTVDQALALPGLPAPLASAASAAVRTRTEQAQQSAQRIQALTEQQDRARQGLQSEADQPLPTANLQDIPQAPSQVQDTDPARVFGQILPVIAMLGGAMVRGDVTAALRAGTSAMNAAKANDASALQQAHQQWVDRLQAINAQNNVAMERLSEIRDNRKMSWDEKLAAFTAYASQVNSEVALMHADDGQFGPIMDYIDRYQRAHQILTDQFLRQEAINADPKRQAFNDFKRQYEQEHGHPPTAQEEAQFLQSVSPRLPFAAISARRAFLNEAVPKGYQQLQAMYPRMQGFVQAALHDPDSAHRAAAQLELLDSFVQMVNGGRAIREFQVSGITHYQTVAGNTEQLLGRLRNGGGPLSSQSIEDVLRVADEYKGAVEQAYAPQEEAFRSRLTAMGIDPDQALNDPAFSDNTNLLDDYHGQTSTGSNPPNYDAEDPATWTPAQRQQWLDEHPEGSD